MSLTIEISLTIKQVSAYFPYKVKGLVHIPTSNTDYIDEIDGIEVRGFYIDISLGGVDTSLHNLKLILRPMGEALEDIDSRGKMRHLYLELAKFMRGELDVNRISHGLFKILVENLYDVFGLIDQGLAVSCHDVGVRYE